MSAYSEAVEADSPLAYWRLGDPSGSPAENKGGTAITLAGGVEYDRPGPLNGGEDEGALSFDGVNDDGKVALNLSAQSKITVELWLKFDANNESDALAMEYTSNFNTQSGFIFNYNASEVSGRSVAGFVNGGTNEHWTDSFTKPTAGAWHHWAIVMDRATPANKVYCDGVLLTNTTVTHAAATYGNFANDALNLMCRNGASLFGGGDMAHLAIYSGELSKARIEAHFAANPSPKYFPPTVRAVGATASGTGTLTPALPAGSIAGDLLLMVCESGGATTGAEANTALTAEGWEAVPNSTQKKGNTRLTTLWCISTGSNNRTTNDTGDHQMARLIAIKAGTFDPAEPFNVTAGSTQASTKAVSTPTVTTTKDNCLVVVTASGALPDATSTAEFGAPVNEVLTELTERIDNATTSGDGGATWASTGVMRSAGVVGATTSTAVTEADRGVATFAINPFIGPVIRAVGAIGANTGSFNTAAPAGTVVGDLLIAVIESGGATEGTEANTKPTITGWTEAKSEKKGNTRLTLFWKIATGSDANAISDTGDHQISRLIGIVKGTFNPEAPINAAESSTQAATKSVSISGATTTVANALLLEATSGHLPDAISTAEFSAWVNAELDWIEEFIDNANTNGDGGAIGVAAGVKRVAGASGTTTATAATEAERAGISIAIAPPSAGGPTKVTLTPATSTEAAIAALGKKSLAATPSAETAAAIAIAARHRPLANAAAETDSAVAIAERKLPKITPAAEIDTAQAAKGKKPLAPAPATEADAAQGVTKRHIPKAVPAAETDVAQVIVFKKARSVTPAAETDAGVAVSVRHRPLAAPAAETDVAQAKTAKKLPKLTAAAETDTALAPSSLTKRSLTAAIETTTMVAREIKKLVTLTPAAETDTAFALHFAKAVYVELPVTLTVSAGASSLTIGGPTSDLAASEPATELTVEYGPVKLSIRNTPPTTLQASEPSSALTGQEEGDV